MIARALAWRTAEQLVRAAVLGYLVASHGIAVGIGIALAATLLISIVAAIVGPNHDSPYLLPAKVDEPVPAPIDRVDATLIPLPTDTGG